MSEPQTDAKKTGGAPKVGFHFHSWLTARDDGYWYYQYCGRCQVRRVKRKESNLSGQLANSLWMKGEAFPTPIGED